jgi:hypothetical protein
MNKTHACCFVMIVILFVVCIWSCNAPSSESYVDAGRCGVGLQSCPDGLRCMNGYCKLDGPPLFHKLADLDVLPPRYESVQ